MQIAISKIVMLWLVQKSAIFNVSVYNFQFENKSIYDSHLQFVHKKQVIISKKKEVFKFEEDSMAKKKDSSKMHRKSNHVVKETNIAVLQFETISLPLIDSRVEWNQPQPRGGKACV